MIEDDIWWEDAHYLAALPDVFANKLGKKEGPLYVYIVWNEVAPLYVGKTERTVHHRLIQHIHDCSRLGKALRRHPTEYENWKIEVVVIDGQGSRALDRAEAYYICERRPALNRTHPRTIIPPLRHVPIKELPRASRNNNAEWNRHLEIMDKWYARAFRDPNHPELREQDREQRQSDATG